LLRDFLVAHPTPSERGVLAPIALAVPSAAAGEFLATTFAETSAAIPPSIMMAAMRHAARYAPLAETERVLEIARRRAESDIGLQLELVQAIDEGYRKREAIPTDQVSRWAAELVAAICDVPLAADWTVIDRDIWGLESRDSADGATAVPFLSSLPGGEQQTGSLRSRDFPLPPRFSFYLCGHRGFPDRRALNGNLVRLRLAKTGEIIRAAFPPRNDSAQKVSWEFDKHVGEQANLEVVDGLDLSAYAWLAVARFDPPLLSVPREALRTRAERLAAAYSLAARFGLTQFTDNSRTTLLDEASSWSLRAAAASAFVALNTQTSAIENGAAWTSLTSLVGQETLPAMLRAEICQCIAAQDESAIVPLAERVMQASSANAQRRFADQLLTNSHGAALLLELIEKGRASARLLRDKAVRDRMAAAQIPYLATRLETLMTTAPTEKDPREIMAAIRGAFGQRHRDADQGQKLFTKHCETCHQVAGRGTVVGPQLDGIGNRGLERVIEDVLDPNRNVDQSFRTVVLALADGRIMGGLVRREDADDVVIVDKEAKEITIALADIEERQPSNLSLMPSDFDTVLQADELTDLLTYLLTLTK
jgi:putative heme-binding domain-containing protein